MLRRLNLSLGQTVAVILAGGLLMASTFLIIPLLHLHEHHGTTEAFLVLLSFLPMAAGMILNLKAASDLNDDIVSQRWPEEEVLKFTAVFKSIPWNAFAIGTVVVACAMFLAPMHSRIHDWAWALITFGQTLARMPWAFRSPPADTPPQRDWQNAPRLHSSHWGNR